MRKALVRFGTVALGLTIGWSHSQTVEQPVVLDRIQIISGIPVGTVPLVRLSINNRPPMLFFLASSVWASGIPIVIDANKAKELGFSQSGVVSVEGARFVNDLGQLSSIKHNFRRALVYPLDLGYTYLGEPVVGVLTASFFTSTPVRLDFRLNRMELLGTSTKQLLEYCESHYLMIKLNRLPSKPHVHSVRVGMAGGQVVEMVLSTSHSLSHLAGRDLQGIDLAEICPTTYRTQTLTESGFVGTQDFLARIAEVSLGSQKIRDTFLVIESELLVDYSVIGMDILSLFDEVILDFTGGYLFLKKPSGTLVGRRPGILGVKVDKDSSGYAVITEIEPAKAGDRAGLQKGDRLLTVGEQSVEKFGNEGIQRLLDGYAGIRQRIKVSREGEIKEIYLTPDDWCVCARGEGGNLFSFSTLLTEVGSEVFLWVTHITSDSARRAGLRVGDKIIEINGYSVSEHRSDLANLIPRIIRDADVLVLRVKRLGDDREVTLRIPKSISPDKGK